MVIVSDVEALRPNGSLMVSVTMKVPASSNAWVTVRPVAVSPSPKSHDQPVIGFVAFEVLPDPSNRID